MQMREHFVSVPAPYYRRGYRGKGAIRRHTDYVSQRSALLEDAP